MTGAAGTLLAPSPLGAPTARPRVEIVAKLEAARQRVVDTWVANAGRPCCTHLLLRHGDLPVWRRQRHRPLLLVARSIEVK